MVAYKVKRGIVKLRKEGAKELFERFTQQAKNRIQARYLGTVYNLRYGPSQAAPDKIIWIDPNRVKYKLIPFFKQRVPSRKQTYYYGGDWDQNKGKPGNVYPKDYNGLPNEQTLIRIKDLDWYNSFESYFNHDVPWEETDLYRRRISEGFNTGRYDSEEGLQERLKCIDELYENIASEGYKTQAELTQQNDAPLTARNWTHEVQVNIGRTGEFILDDGRNRLILAQILNVSKIPVRVLVRHKKWQQLRKEIYNTGLYKEHEELRDHPDLQDVLD